jgi:ribonuclease PH
MNRRADGRAPNQIRPITIEAPFLGHAEGSASIRVGNTWVVCAATVIDRQPPFMKGEARGWVTAEYGMLPRSVPNRLSRGRPSGRTEEIQRLVGRSLRTCVDLAGLAMHTIVIDCDVLQADGGTRAASLTAGFVAMCLAMGWMMRGGRILRIPVRDQIAALSYGLVDGELLCDPTHGEDSRASADITLIRAARGGVVGLYAAAEVEPFPPEELPRMIALSSEPLEAHFVEQRRALGLAPDRPFDASEL